MTNVSINDKTINTKTIVLAERVNLIFSAIGSVFTLGWLLSMVDEYACHARRYTAPERHNKVSLAGFTIVRSTSSVTSLLPSILISRLLQQGKSESFDPHAELRINLMLNRILEGFFAWSFG
jgi:hypothetical protein